MDKFRNLIAVMLIVVLVSSNSAVFGQTDSKSAVKKGEQTDALKSETAPPQVKNIGAKKAETFSPVSFSGKSSPVTEVKKKKFPWLLVGGIVVAGVVATILLLKKKKDPNQPIVPSVTTGSIQVESTPPGANIFFDGNETGKATNTTLTSIAPGNYTIKLVLYGFGSYEQSVTVQVGQTAKISATLIASIIPREPVMVRLVGGTFMMGSESSEAFADEKPVHQVTLSGFEMGKFEVTQAEWFSVMGSYPSTDHEEGRPIELVTWNDVQWYIQRLNALTGKNYRLPTEAEWEYACRAGTTEDRYGELDSIAWYGNNSGNRTHDVGEKAPNGFGLYDMLGNVWEWCADWYGAYSAGSVTNPKGPSSGSFRVCRGSSWLEPDARFVRAPYRSSYDPSFKRNNQGFRLARD
ncbi:MAG: SUMF1/EgtB/PvdO family nonheme iron enzyme [Candidatus Aminicenantes bacterium]|nr:SUMF1/EgtB/PvdO family nonheme iron enzyme [Candidatus Aminicenantes bacterium]